MSVSSVLSSINSVQREIQSAQRKVSDKSKQEADKTGRIASIQRSITKHTSPSTLESKRREIENLQRDISRIQIDRANAEKVVADKTERLHKLQQDLYREQDREHSKSLKKLEKIHEENSKKTNAALRKLAEEVPRSSLGMSNQSETARTHDVFISHASEDKEAIARPLAEALRENGVSVWYDEFELRLGDSLRRSIDRGLANSRFGIVVLSPNFFAKNWTQYELDGLVQREMQGSKVILPIWHKLSKDEVISYSPSLADKLALNTALLTIADLAAKIQEALQGT